MIQKYLLVIALCLFCACKNNSSADFFKNVNKISGEVVAIDCMMGTPTMILYAKPQKIILYDRYEHELMTLVDLSERRCVRFMREGNGPGEWIPGFKMYVSSENQTAGIYHAQTGTLKQYDLHTFTVTDVNSLQTASELNIADTPTAASVIPVGNRFIGIGCFEKGRIHLYDSQGKLIASGGTYPFRGEEMDPVSRFLAYQSYTVSNGKDKFAVASSYGDNLEFYAVEKDDLVLKNKHESRDAEFSIENGMIHLHDDCLLGYKGAWGGKKYCYLLFSGKSYAENNHKKIGAKYVLVFSWDGRLIKSYETADTIWSLCVDEENQIMYAIAEHEDEMAVMRYAL